MCAEDSFFWTRALGAGAIVLQNWTEAAGCVHVCLSMHVCWCGDSTYARASGYSCQHPKPKLLGAIKLPRCSFNP